MLQKYDVLQVNRGRGWQDYATLKDASDFDYATVIVDLQRDHNNPEGCVNAQFRIVRGCAETVVYPR